MGRCKLLFVLCVCGLVFSAGYGDVGDMVPASQLTATSSTSHDIYPDPMVVVNGSGMSGDAHINTWGSWCTAEVDPDRWIVVDLGGTYHIGDVKVWNCNESWGWSLIGFNESAFYVANMADPGNPVDNAENWELITTAVLTEAPDDPSYDTPDIIDLGGNEATHVALQCVTPTREYGDDRAGLSELRFFEGVPAVKGQAYDPVPQDGADGVPLDQVLSWTIGEDPNNPDVPNPAITRHFVFMSDGVGTELALVDTIDVPNPTEYTPAGLERDKTYYWRIDEGIENYPAGDPNNIIGNVWSFETVLSVPVIDPETPADVIVYAGENAVFEVIATNPFGDPEDLSYQWYKYVDGVNDTPVGTGDTTYSIVGVEDSDQGLYYCRVTIGFNDATSDSRMASLATKRLIGHWPFDNKYDDVVGGNDGEPNDTMDFVSGIVGTKALQFDGIADFVTIPPAALSEIYNRVTISLWQFGGETQPSEDTIFEAFDDEGVRVLGTHTPWGNSVYFDAGNPDDGYDRINKSAEENEYKGQWNNWVYIKDAVSGDMELYLNGLLWHSGTGRDIPMYGATNFLIGAGVTDGQEYDGIIDDLRLYNYALSPTEVAVIYSDVMGTFCAVEPELDYDDNCIVDLGDFATFAESWLECGLFPDCIDTIE
jgi:hypothetical protein